MAEKITTLKQAIENIDLEKVEAGVITDIYMEDPQTLQKVTLQIKKAIKEEPDLRDKWNRWSKHVINIVEGWLDFKNTDKEINEVKAEVEAMSRKMQEHIDNRIVLKENQKI